MVYMNAQLITSCRPYFVSWDEGIVVDEKGSPVDSMDTWDDIRVRSFAFVRNLAEGNSKADFEFEWVKNGDDAPHISERFEKRKYGFAEFVRRTAKAYDNPSNVDTIHLSYPMEETNGRYSQSNNQRYDTAALHVRVFEGRESDEPKYKSAWDIRLYDKNGSKVTPELHTWGVPVEYGLQKRIEEMHTNLLRSALRV